jgi:hypothetical protein
MIPHCPDKIKTRCAHQCASPDRWGGRDCSLPCRRNHTDCPPLCKSIHKLDEFTLSDLQNLYVYNAASSAKSPISSRLGQRFGTLGSSRVRAADYARKTDEAKSAVHP